LEVSTSVPTLAGFLYRATELDAWSCKIVGSSMANHLRAALVLDVRERAVGQRRPMDVIHHSDQVNQYAQLYCDLAAKLTRLGVLPVLPVLSSPPQPGG
jgi:transposase InsO family protein